jgi:hypothetical protein
MQLQGSGTDADFLFLQYISDINQKGPQVRYANISPARLHTKLNFTPHNTWRTSGWMLGLFTQTQQFFLTRII